MNHEAFSLFFSLTACAGFLTGFCERKGVSPETALAAGSWLWERYASLHPIFPLWGPRCARLAMQRGHRDLLPLVKRHGAGDEPLREAGK